MAGLPQTGPLLRRLAPCLQTECRLSQQRWAQVHDIRFLATHTSTSRIQDRYREKLERKAREKGLKDVEQLKQVYSEHIQELRKKAIVPGANAPLSSTSTQHIDTQIPYRPPPAPTPQTTASYESSSKSTVDKHGKAKVKTLGDFVDVAKIAELPQKDIESLWRMRHMEDPQSLCAVMQTSTYERIASTAVKHPQFILPLPREGQGAEIHYLQWTFPSPTTATVLLTHLAEFKARGEYAQPHTTATHHLDLSRSNGLVLMEGRTMENRGITVDESKWLLMCLQKFYGFVPLDEIAKDSADRRKKLMEQFSGGDAAFKIEDLLAEAERVP